MRPRSGARSSERQILKRNEFIQASAPRTRRGYGACRVKRVAVFGNAGGGKSTLARRLAELTRLPLYVVDMMQFREGGVAVPHDEFLKVHAELLQRDAWVI